MIIAACAAPPLPRPPERLARGHTERAAHELKILHQHHGLRAADFAEGGGHAIFAAHLGARGFQAIDVFLFVFELQRIRRHLRQRDVLPGRIIEQQFKARLRPDAHVKARGRHPMGGFQIGAVHQLARERILNPEIVRRITGFFGLFLGSPAARNSTANSCGVSFFCPRGGTASLRAPPYARRVAASAACRNFIHKRRADDDGVGGFANQARAASGVLTQTHRDRQVGCAFQALHRRAGAWRPGARHARNGDIIEKPDAPSSTLVKRSSVVGVARRMMERSRAANAARSGHLLRGRSTMIPHRRRIRAWPARALHSPCSPPDWRSP